MIRAFNRDTYDKEQLVIIYGAGQYGELALHGLRSLNIPVDFFLDHVRKGELFHGIPVLDPSEIVKYEKANVLVASLNYYGEMINFLKTVNHKNVYHILDLMKLEYDESVLHEYAKDQKNSYKRYEDVVKHFEKDKLIVRHCEMVLTEKCTLRCKDCANFMQYYENPENLNVEQIIEKFDLFLKTIDKLLELRLIGGEPFICSDIDRIINYYSANQKISKITIYTNSTVIPSEKVLKALEKENVSVHMSNYGIYSRHIEELKRIFTSRHINHYEHKYQKWCDMGDPHIKQKYSDGQVKNIYKICASKNCHTFYRNNFYICPRQAHGERLGFFANKEEEYVDFNSLSDIEEKRIELEKLLSKSDGLEACYFCNGFNNATISINAAMQLK